MYSGGEGCVHEARESLGSVSETHTHTYVHRSPAPGVGMHVYVQADGGHRLHLACGYEVRFGVWVAWVEGVTRHSRDRISRDGDEALEA